MELQLLLHVWLFWLPLVFIIAIIVACCFTFDMPNGHWKRDWIPIAIGLIPITNMLMALIAIIVYSQEVFKVKYDAIDKAKIRNNKFARWITGQ